MAVNLYSQIAVNKQRTVMLMVLFLAVVVGFGYFFSVYYEEPALLTVAIAFSLFMSFSSYWFSDKLALSVAGARPLDENNHAEKELLRLVENLSITAGLPMPKVYIIEDDAMNAFATGRDPHHATVAVTRGLFERLDRVELEGVIAHELSHVKNYDILLSTVVVVLVGFVVMAADWFLRVRPGRRRDDEGQAGNILLIVGLVFAILAPLFVRLIHFAISRRREFLADASGAMLTRYPEGLASALVKISKSPPLRRGSRATAHLYIDNPFDQEGDGSGMERIATLFSTHPPVRERVKALLGMSGMVELRDENK